MINIICALVLLFPISLMSSPLPFDEKTLETINYNDLVVVKQTERAAPSRPYYYYNSGLCSRSHKFDSSVDLQTPLDAYILSNNGLNGAVTIKGNVFKNSNELYSIRRTLDMQSFLFDTTSRGDFSDSYDYLDYTKTPFDGRKVITHFRGYLNVFSGFTETIGLNANDGGLLLIAGKPVLYIDYKSPFNKVTRQVQFEGEGLYPFEIIYYQNNDNALIELSALSGSPTNAGFSFGYTNINISDLENNKYLDDKGNPYKMSILNKWLLFNTIDGYDGTSCQMCDETKDCNQGFQCISGLCQDTKVVCRSNKMCGTTCSPCANEKDVCTEQGACAECINDSTCTLGNMCDTNTNKCVPRPPECTQDSDCKYSWSTSEYVCNTSVNKCELKKPECTVNTDCKTGQICNLEHKCQDYDPSYIKCTDDSGCSLNAYCNAEQQKCVPLTQGGCRAQVQCFSGYTCDTTARMCIKVEQPDTGDSKPTPSNNSPVHSCNNTGASFPIEFIFGNIIGMALILRKRIMGK